MIDELLQTLGKLALMRPLIRQDNERRARRRERDDTLMRRWVERFGRLTPAIGQSARRRNLPNR